MADPEHVVLAKAGANAIARWREVNHVIPNAAARHTLNYQLEDQSTSEVFAREFVYGRPKLDLSGAILCRAKLPGADLAHDQLNRVDLTSSNLRMADLRGANLHSAHLSRSNLAHAILTGANMARCSLTRSNLSRSTLRSADLTGADLSSSDLRFANLEGANLSQADLSLADLTGANLNGVNLRGSILSSTTLQQADLTGADLRGASLIKADLESATFFEAVLGITTFVNCDLSMAIALEFARHTGPSAIGLDTLAKSRGRIPGKFLEDAGVAAPLIEAQGPLAGVNRDFPSVLTIGSMEDGELAGRLRDGLRAAQIPCWNVAADDEAGIQSGATIIDHTVYFDRLVLLCTAPALESPQTRRYMSELAGGKGPESRRNIISLAAGTLFDHSQDGLCAILREGTVVDFRGWEEEGVFETAVATLVNVLSGVEREANDDRRQ